MTVYFAHATSFCGAVWSPVISRLEDVECVTWDFAGHGVGPPLNLPVDWQTFGVQVLDETAPGGIGVGHSMGATALMMAQLADPKRFRFLVLIEPTVFPGPHARRENALSVITLKRKRKFESRRAASEYFVSRDPFSKWDASALEAYVRCGFIGDGDVELACDPEVEADIYRASYAHETWERLGEIEIPVLILTGETSSPIPPELARQQRAQFQRAGLEVVPGAGHLLPMEVPELVADRIRRLVSAFS